MILGLCWIFTCALLKGAFQCLGRLDGVSAAVFSTASLL